MQARLKLYSLAALFYVAAMFVAVLDARGLSTMFGG